MRNKIFAVVFGLFLVVVMISAPVKTALTNAGIIESENVGNVIEVEKVYEEGTFGASLFNAIEEAKRDINDTYTNYIPFYVGITSTAESFKQRLNQPVTSFLLELGNKIMLERKEEGSKLTETKEEPPVSSPATGSDVPPETNPDTAPETVPETEPAEPPFETIYNTVYLKGDNRHRYYEITAKTGEDDPLVDFYIRVPAQDSEKLRPTMEKQASAINDFASRRPDVNWYVFPVTCFEDTELCEELLPAESKHGLFTDFFAKLDKGIQYDYIEINDIRDKETLYYKTDHHWNVYGYTEGYRLITEMFKENYSDITPLTPVIHTFDDEVTLYGSNALAVANYKMHDIFHAADFSLPKHDYVIESGVSYGGKDSIEQSLEKYLNKKHNTSRSYSHYILFQPITREITYPENNTGRNLLIIGDSYSPPLLEALASHFDKTIVRYVDSNKALTTVKYEELIDQNNITDVLLLEMSDRVIYDYYSDSLKGLK